MSESLMGLCTSSKMQPICELIAEALSIKPRQVTIETGQSSAEKVVRISGVTMARVHATIRL